MHFYSETRLDVNRGKTFWVDNYSNITSSAHVSINVGNVRILLWAVEALITCADVRNVDQQVMYDDEGNVVGALGPHALAKSDVLRDAITRVDEEGFNYWDRSIIVSRNVQTVPPIPSPDAYPTSSQYHQNLQLHINRLKEVTPLGIYPINPASNEGCFRMLQKSVIHHQQDCEYWQDEEVTPSYCILVSDVNIYPRWLQVINFLP